MVAIVMIVAVVPTRASFKALTMQDYTEMLLGRSSSDLKFDNHYRCLQLEGRGDFGKPSGGWVVFEGHTSWVCVL